MFSGRKTYGARLPDQPVFAWDVVRFMGEPVAAVAADHPDTARRAAAAIVVDYAPTEPMTDPALRSMRRRSIRWATSWHRQWVRCGDPEAVGAVVVEGRYERRCRTRAQMGPSPGSRFPGEDGGVDL